MSEDGSRKTEDGSLKQGTIQGKLKLQIVKWKYGKRAKNKLLDKTREYNKIKVAHIHFSNFRLLASDK